VYLRRSLSLFSLCLCLASGVGRAQSLSLPDAPQPSATLPDPPSSSLADSSAPSPTTTASSSVPDDASSSSADYVDPSGFSFDPPGYQSQSSSAPQAPQHANAPLDADGKPIPLNRLQPQRILGFMPNFRSVSGGSKPHPPGWKYNFEIATHQATDYSSFIFLGITSITAEAMNSHPVLGKGIGGFYAYTWRGFLDKTDGTYLSAWLLPSLLHEDTRYYALGDGHSIAMRALYVISRQAVARTYSGAQTPNIAGLGGKVLTQVISRYYYPPGATSFGVLATKFGYSAMRDIGFSAIREFYPDVAAHYIRKHREKVARQAAHDAQSSKTPKP
jgi:hypothetical protein